MLEWVLSAVKTSLGYLCFIFYQKWTRLLHERTVSSSDTIWSLATIREATMYIYFFVSFPQKRNGIVFSSGVNYLHSGGNIQSELSS